MRTYYSSDPRAYLDLVYGTNPNRDAEWSATNYLTVIKSLLVQIDNHRRMIDFKDKQIDNLMNEIKERT